MAQTFGNTWWGKEWLRALTNIDYQNRIPRGATYARTGKVLDLEIKNSVIKARVRGSRPTPYKEVIELTPFTAQEKRELLDEILKRPALVMQLLNRNLLPEIFEIARQHKIQIFPRQWRDLGMKCSCPDWAVPCKHLAAVIYMIGMEIDNNPFVLFQMKGLDLIKELESRGIVNRTMTKNIEVPTLESLIEKPSPKKNQNAAEPTKEVTQANSNTQSESQPESSNSKPSSTASTATTPEEPVKPVKRGRGRPRKVKPEEQAVQSQPSVTEAETATTQNSSEANQDNASANNVTDTVSDTTVISSAENNNNTEVQSFDSQLTLTLTDHGSPETIEEIINHKAPDFSVLQNRMEALINILPDAPSFYADGNFRDIYREQLEKVAATVEKFFTKKNQIELVFPTEMTANGLPDYFTLDDKPKVEFNGDMNWKSERVSMSDLPYMLWSINPDFLPDFSAYVRALYTAMLTALQLARNGLVQPKIFRNSKDNYLVRWMPATQDQQVVQIMEQLQKLMPEDILSFKSVSTKKMEVGNSATWLVSYFLTRLYDELSSSKVDKDIYLLIFKGFRSKFDKIGYREIPGSIKSWFDFAGVITSGWLPVISIRETTMEWDDYATFAMDVSLEVDEREIQAAKEASKRKETEDSESSSSSNSEKSKTAKGKKTKLSRAEKEKELEAEYNAQYINSLNAATSTERQVIELKRIMQDPELASIRYQVLNGLSRLCTVIPEISEYINNGGEHPIVLKQDELPNLVMKIIPAVRMLGVKTFLPKSLRQLIRPRPSISISTKGDSDQTFLSLKDMFEYDWRVAVGDELITYEEFQKLARGARGLIRFKKSFIYFTESDLKKLSDAFTGKPLAPYQVLQAAIAGDYEGMPVQLTEAAKTAVEKFRSFSEVAVPQSVNATLRPYQLRGYSWMFNNMQLGFGSVLADDMGLGKTLQTITLMAKLKEENALDKEMMLVIAPSGLLSNWSEEIRRFAPSLRTTIYHGTSRELPKPKDVDVILTSYGMARRDKDILKKKKWRLMVIDEAQNIKNPKAQQSAAVQAIPAKCRIALSGTPVENRLSEFWSIMEYANHGYLGSLNDFNKVYSKPIQVNNDVAVAEKFKKVTGPFMMRRMKTDKSIINDLPDKVERDVMASLTPEQSALYDETLQEAMSIIEGIPTDDAQQLFKRQGLILQMILALKQICNHPAQFLKNDDYRSDLSGKMEILLSMVESIVESNEKVLIFTQFREMGEILQNVLTKHFGREPLFYHGGVTLDKRKEMVDRFQNNRADQVMILSLKAAGTGLNLTAASHVIHYDLWWNPAVEAQATDRAYRIGQHKNVQVNRFITQGTFEQKINDIINSKRNLADMTVASGESWIGHLSNTELREIFSI